LKHNVITGLLFLSAFTVAGQHTIHSESSTAFIENKGQVIDQNNKPNPDVLYLLNTPGMNVQLRANGWSYDVYKIEETDTLPFAFRHSLFAKGKLANNNANSEQQTANSKQRIAIFSTASTSTSSVPTRTARSSRRIRPPVI